MLLNDSTYVKAYRDATYSKIRNTKAEGKHGGIGTIGYVAGALAVFAVVFFGLNKMWFLAYIKKAAREKQEHWKSGLKINEVCKVMK